jgi:NAD(P)-dependent dehydrogenase (short-subunit alcohol dehydrogenase family)
MRDAIQFDGRVVIVTGAGGGLGRAHAMEFARRGAQVVVNDVGKDAIGPAAQRVVDEIKAAGGVAVANEDSVTEGHRIVATAMDSFGRLDVLVNNAGILRDSAFHKMTDDDWDAVIDIHLRGAFAVTRAAWPIMREASFGRIVMTASAAGIYGNFGQANYAAAKLGLYGLAQSLAIEGASRNILANTIAPGAASRMTETVMPPYMLERLKPELVAPLVILLCDPGGTATGGLYEVAGGVVAKLRWESSFGATFDPEAGFTAEALRDRYVEVADFAKTWHPDSLGASMQRVAEHIGVGLSLTKQQTSASVPESRT